MGLDAGNVYLVIFILEDFSATLHISVMPLSIHNDTAILFLVSASALCNSAILDAVGYCSSDTYS